MTRIRFYEIMKLITKKRFLKIKKGGRTKALQNKWFSVTKWRKESLLLNRSLKKKNFLVENGRKQMNFAKANVHNLS